MVEEIVEEVVEVVDDILLGGDGDVVVVGVVVVDVIFGLDGKLMLFDGLCGGQVDDLKKIEGIGFKLEELCNSFGIYYYDQIVVWGEVEVVWMDGNMLCFKGCVICDKWVVQVKLILEVGMEEFLECVKINDY